MTHSGMLTESLVSDDRENLVRRTCHLNVTQEQRAAPSFVDNSPLRPLLWNDSQRDSQSTAEP